MSKKKTTPVTEEVALETESPKSETGLTLEEYKELTYTSVVKFKLLNAKATPPKMANYGDAAFDLYAIGFEVNTPGVLTISTGLAFEIPYGHVGEIYGRSGLGSKGIFLTNGIGIIDSGYRGEVKVLLSAVRGDIMLENLNKTARFSGVSINIGDRVAQMAIREVPNVTLTQVEELSESSRGTGGFGSSGK